MVKESLRPFSVSYSLLSLTSINSYIDFAIKSKLHSYCSLSLRKRNHIDYIGAKYIVKMNCLKHLNVVSFCKIHKSHWLMLQMSSALLNIRNRWHHKTNLAWNHRPCFCVPAILKALSIMVMVVVSKKKVFSISSFKKFLQSHFVNMTTLVFYLGDK